MRTGLACDVAAGGSLLLGATRAGISNAVSMKSSAEFDIVKQSNGRFHPQRCDGPSMTLNTAQLRTLRRKSKNYEKPPS
ncbi:MAG: hypothetical protein DWI21_07820 [Planctomycetota bacterium]|nr:MAG: hypothetical protein DWI21_07820 [Planctomycetota bacterium]